MLIARFDEWDLAVGGTSEARKEPHGGCERDAFFYPAAAPRIAIAVRPDRIVLKHVLVATAMSCKPRVASAVGVVGSALFDEGAQAFGKIG